jgi:hypothetical protein
MAQLSNAKKRIVFAALVLILMGLLHFVSASENDISELKRLISSFDDPKITAQDLAFFLLTHNLNAKPVGDYVELDMNGATYKLIPNKDKPGLCDILPSDSLQ